MRAARPRGCMRICTRVEGDLPNARYWYSTAGKPVETGHARDRVERDRRAAACKLRPRDGRIVEFREFSDTFDVVEQAAGAWLPVTISRLTLFCRWLRWRSDRRKVVVTLDFLLLAKLAARQDERCRRTARIPPERCQCPLSVHYCQPWRAPLKSSDPTPLAAMKSFPGSSTAVK